MKEYNIGFEGFYHSIHSELIDFAIDNVLLNDNEDLRDALYSLDYGYRELIEQYARQYVSVINDELGLKFRFVELDSPEYFNYRSDIIYCKVTDKDIKRIYKETDLIKFTEYLQQFNNLFVNYPLNLKEFDIELKQHLIKFYIDSNISDYYCFLSDAINTIELVLNHFYSLKCPSVQRILKIGDYLQNREQRSYSKGIRV